MKLFNRYRVALLSALPLALCALSAAAQVVQEYEYAPDRIYQVRTGLGITTQVELSPNEKFWITAPVSLVDGSSRGERMFLSQA